MKKKAGMIYVCGLAWKWVAEVREKKINDLSRALSFL